MILYLASKKRNCVRKILRFFYFTFGHTFCVAFYLHKSGGYKKMQLTLIKNTDKSKSVSYKIARIVFAETGAKSLRVVEAMTSMIKNHAIKFNRDFTDIISDANLFTALNVNSPNHNLINVAADDNRFQMCLRVAGRMLNNSLPDCCYGATCCHHDEYIPQWATSRGYIADIDGFLFYL